MFNISLFCIVSVFNKILILIDIKMMQFPPLELYTHKIVEISSIVPLEHVRLVLDAVIDKFITNENLSIELLILIYFLHLAKT